MPWVAPNQRSAPRSSPSGHPRNAPACQRTHNKRPAAFPPGGHGMDSGEGWPLQRRLPQGRCLQPPGPTRVSAPSEELALFFGFAWWCYGLCSEIRAKEFRGEGQCQEPHGLPALPPLTCSQLGLERLQAACLFVKLFDQILPLKPLCGVPVHLFLLKCRRKEKSHRGEKEQGLPTL